MGLIESVFGRKINKIIESYFKTFLVHSPVFTSYNGGLYEMELVRAAIHSFASACSKLKPEMTGTAHKNLEKLLQFRPNPFMDTSKFLYRIATILSVHNTAFIVPMEDEYGRINGYYPILPESCEILESDGKAYLRYTFATGERAVIEYEKVGVMTQFQYKDDFFGEDNSALKPTMQLIHTQNQGIINGIKNSANIRFIGRIANAHKPEDIEKERKRFTEENLSAENHEGIILHDAKIADVKQIDSKPFIVNTSQMQQIKENVFNYFGTNEDILQNKYNEDTWGAYYEGKVEPFCVQLSLVLSNMTFTQAEIKRGNSIHFSSDRLQYASNSTKLNISTQLFDRALLNRDGVMDIWNRPHVEGGDEYFIRGEYIRMNELKSGGGNNATNEQDGIQNVNLSAYSSGAEQED